MEVILAQDLWTEKREFLYSEASLIYEDHACDEQL